MCALEQSGKEWYVTMDKQAFLIMAYDDVFFLKCLLKAIDHPKIDIYIHIDKNKIFDKTEFDKVCQYSSLFFVKNEFITWGGFNIIKAELNLLKASTEHDHYIYYHLLSGHDFILKRIDYILEFFEMNKGKLFIDCRKQLSESIKDRIKYYYPFQQIYNGKSTMNRILNKMCIFIQKSLFINRLRHYKFEIGYGSQWFSISDDFAREVIENEKFIYKHFNNGLCVDEMFIQTILLKSNDYKKNIVNISNNINNNFETCCQNALRAIDFSKGDGRSPRTYSINDYELLLDTDCLFARKFNTESSLTLIEKFYDEWQLTMPS